MTKTTLIALLIGSILLVGLATVYAGETTKIHFRAEKYLNGELGINYKAKRLESDTMTIEEHICKASNGEYCNLLVNLAKCESSLDKDAINVNTNGSVDFGLFQINSIHNDISNLDKFDVYASTRWAVKKIKEGKGHIWVCWRKI